MKKTIFISFDFDHDRRYAYLLAALAENPRFTIDFQNRTPGEIRSDDVGRVKAAFDQAHQ